MISLNPLIPSEKLDETSDEDAAELVSQPSSRSDAVMEDLNFMMYGDMQEPLTPDGMEIATIHWSKRTHFNLRGDRDAEIRGDIVNLKYRYESVRFLYDLKTGRATYLLACTDNDFEYYAKALEGRKMPAGRRPHPFSIHFILLFKSVLERNQALEDSLRSLLLLEDRSIFRKSKVTFETADDTKRRLQDLHSLFKEAVISDNNNKRQIATIDCLIRDLDRLAKTVKENPWACPIDEHDHQRIIDGFRCLKDFCQDRERRLKSRSQRVQNLIAL
ncbi:MAG: hypothetical protein Q9207_007926, partial [Kuettlingeria erythrocarpa]